MNRTAKPPRTKMVEDFQIQVLKKSKKSQRKHTCPVCLVDGHHAKTCGNILAPENSGRFYEYLKRLHASGKLREFIVSLAKKRSITVATTVIAQLVSKGVLSENESLSLTTPLDEGQSRCE